MLYTNLIKIDPVVLEKKMLMDDGRRTLHDAGPQPIPKVHLSNSGDLTTSILYMVIWQTTGF